MSGGHRGFMHQLAALYGVESESFDREPNRFPRLRKPAAMKAAAGAAAGAAAAGSSDSTSNMAPSPELFSRALTMEGILAMPRVPIVEAVKLWVHRLPVEVVGEQGRKIGSVFGPGMSSSSSSSSSMPKRCVYPLRYSWDWCSWDWC
jgi:hypothetical protein